MAPRNDNPSDPADSRQGDTILAHAEITQWDGPLPPPAAFQMYEATLPGTAERLLSMAEEHQRHRISQERRALELTGESMAAAREAGRSDSRRSYLGIILAFIIAMTGLLGGIMLIATGRGGFGLALCLSMLVGLAAVFVYGARSRRAERSRRRAENAAGPE